MITEDQSAIVDFLASPSTYGETAVERIDTHTAVVFLAGRRAYKLKRAVWFDYLDCSTAEKRRQHCEAEVTLNRRTAPTLYRRILPITRESDGSLALDGAGSPVDWLVEMSRFPQEALFDRLAAAGRLDLARMPPLADAIAAFHSAAERRRDHGGRAGMQWVIDGNASGFEEFGAGRLDMAACRRLTEDVRRKLDRHAALLDRRRDCGYVRHCHGDLHLRNIVLLDDRPTLFDGVEFHDEIACIDVEYDLAFLLMDLWHRGLPRHANLLWNRYLTRTQDLSGLPLLPLFLSCRAAVRAKTSATAASFEADGRRRADFEDQARAYLNMAQALLRPSGPSLIAIGGLSGSGKSNLAMALAYAVGDAPGAVVLRSDEIRKRLCGVAPLDRLGADGYSAGTSERVYRQLIESATAIVRSGQSVIVDAVFAHALDRRRIQRVADETSSAFLGLWLDAPLPVLIERATARTNDPSDADADVIRAQWSQSAGTIEWRHLDASRSTERVLESALGLLNADADELSNIAR
jgi:aminoglycoside phosphotransferase family enzyme/predicted kinase